MSESSLKELRSRLHELLDGVVVTQRDCGCRDGIEIRPLVQHGELLERLGATASGRVLGENACFGKGDDLLELPTGTLITSDLAASLEQVNFYDDELFVRSVVLCDAADGVCATCLGAVAETGELPPVGFEAGRWAADQIRDLGKVLPYANTFHIGGSAASSEPEEPVRRANVQGLVRLIDAKVVTRGDGSQIVLNRKSRLVLEDDQGRERDSHDLLYGAELHVTEGAHVGEGDLLATWDDKAIPILSPSSGIVHFKDLTAGTTLLEFPLPDGGSRRIVRENFDQSIRPRIVLLCDGQVLGRLFLPAGAVLAVTEGQEVAHGDPLASIPRQPIRTVDRPSRRQIIEASFEARSACETGLMAEVDGVAMMEFLDESTVRVRIQPDGGGKESVVDVPHDDLTVHERDFIRAGDLITHGEADPRDLFKIRGEKVLVRHLAEAIAGCYAIEQGPGRPDGRAYEVVFREMLAYYHEFDSWDAYERGKTTLRKKVREPTAPSRGEGLDIPDQLFGALKALARGEDHVPPNEDHVPPNKTQQEPPITTGVLLGLSELLDLKRGP